MMENKIIPEQLKKMRFNRVRFGDKRAFEKFREINQKGGGKYDK